MSSSSSDIIFKNFDSAQGRKINSAPAGGSVPSSPVPSPTTTTKNTVDTKNVVAFATSSPTETSRCADAFTEEQRKVMARFANGDPNAATNNNNDASMTRNKAMEMLLNKDRSKTSLLVAELRKDAERMRKNEERELANAKTHSEKKIKNVEDAGAAAAAAAATTEEATTLLSSSPFDDFDESQLDRFSSLAAESGAKQRTLEKCRRVETEEKAERQQLNEVLVEEWKIVSMEVTSEMKKSLDLILNRNDDDNASTTIDDEADVDEEETASSNNCNVKTHSVETNEGGDAMTTTEISASQQQRSTTSTIAQHHQSSIPKRVTFSHLSTRRAGKMTEETAAKIIQRQIRRFAAVASSQRFLSLLHLAHISSSNISSSFPYGSVCSCPTTALWLKNGGNNNSSSEKQQQQQQKFSLSCSSGCKSVPYQLQCLLAAVLEYEVRLHSENLSQFYIAAEEEQARKNRKGSRVSRISSQDKNSYVSDSDDDGEELVRSNANNNNNNKKLKPHHSFRIFRKSVLSNEEAEEILNMIKTALAGEHFYDSSRMKTSSSKSHHQGESSSASSSEEDDENDDQKINNQENSNDMSKLAARWVVDSLAPFHSHSVCKLLGGFKNHEASMNLIFSRSNKNNNKTQKSDNLVFYDTKTNSISSTAFSTETENKENSNPSSSTMMMTRKNPSSNDGNNNKSSNSDSVVAKLTGSTTYFLSLPPATEWLTNPSSSTSFLQQEEEGDDNDFSGEGGKQRERILEKMKEWSSSSSSSPRQDSHHHKDLSTLMHVIPDEKILHQTQEKNTSSNDEKRKTTAEQLEELRIEQETLIATLPQVADYYSSSSSSSGVTRNSNNKLLLSDDERSLLQDLGQDDPVIAEMLEQIENAEDEEMRAVQAETDRKLSFAMAIQKAAQANLKRMKAVSTGCGGDDDDHDDDVAFKDDDAQEAKQNEKKNQNDNRKWLPINDEVRRFGAVISSSKHNNSSSSATTSIVVKSMICVVCELDDDDTEKCHCGNYFHRDCGVANGDTKVFKCCESCK